MSNAFRRMWYRPTYRNGFAPPRAGELSAKLTEGAVQAQMFGVGVRGSPYDRYALASPACGGRK